MAVAGIYQRKWLFIRLPIALAALLAMAWLWQQWLPLPPQHVTLSSGRTDGVYHAYALQYSRLFAERGYLLEVATSDGAIENLARLRGTAQPPAELAFLQGGTAHTDRDGTNGGLRLVTLARVDLEPVWIFSRVPGIDSLQQLAGLRVSLGGAGSGTRTLATVLLEQVRLTPRDVADSSLAGMEAVQAMRQGSLDAMFVVASPDSPVVRALLESPGIALVQLGRSAALIERLPYLQLRLLPQGALDSTGRNPPQDTAMLVTTASLVARDDLHPALQRLATAVARQVHSGAGVFHRAGEFPSLRLVEFPASAQARRTLAQGLPWLEETLPFWWAQVLLRIGVICVPLALVAWWLAHMLPAYLRWLVESRLARWYGELKYIELDLGREQVSGLDLTKYLKRLDGIEKRMSAFTTPDDLVPRWFTLRQHIHFVRLRLHKQRGR